MRPCAAWRFSRARLRVRAARLQAAMGWDVTETAEHRLKRMTMRSWRRGTKEMDLILGPFADAHLAKLDPDDLDLYEVLLEENDQDLIGHVLGQTQPAEELAALLTRISSFARHRLASGE